MIAAASLVLAFLDLASPVIFLLRVAAAVGGGIIGWFFAAPLVRILVRVFFRRSYPRRLIFPTRIFGALGTALLFFYYAPIGGSGSGLGWGAGPGGGRPGAVGGPGTGAGPIQPGDPAKNLGNTIAKSQRTIIEIELVGGSRYQGDQRFYLRRGLDKIESLAELEKALINQKNDIEVCIVLVKDSPGDPAPQDQLIAMLLREGIRFTQRDETLK